MEIYLKSKLRLVDFIVLHIVFYTISLFFIWLGFNRNNYIETTAAIVYSIGFVFFIAYLGCNLLFFYKMRYNKVGDLLIMLTFVITLIGLIFLNLISALN